MNEPGTETPGHQPGCYYSASAPCVCGLVRTFKPGDRVIYTKLARPMLLRWPARYIRGQVVNGRQMHVIELEVAPGHPRQVGDASLEPA